MELNQYNIPPHPAQNRIFGTSEKPLFADISDFSTFSRSNLPGFDLGYFSSHEKKHHRKLEEINSNTTEEKEQNLENTKPPPPEPKKDNTGWWKKMGEVPDPEYDLGIPPNRKSLSSVIFKTLKKSDILVHVINTTVGNQNYTSDIPGDLSSLKKSEISAASYEETEVQNSSTEEYQEWMILSGGFTDRDWMTFPVWAYDLTVSRETGKGTWVPLQVITPDFKREKLDESENGEESSLGSPDSQESRFNNNGPYGRVGHMSTLHNGYLYVFGGLMFRDRMFSVDEEFIIWRAKIDHLLSENRDVRKTEATGDLVLDWETLIPKIISDVDESDIQHLPRGEAVGAMYYQKEINGEQEEHEKPFWIFHGGLTTEIDHLDVRHSNPSIDLPLGDMWSYDFERNELELINRGCDVQTYENCANSPIARTAHAGTIVGEEFVVYGGMTTYLDSDLFGEMKREQKWEMYSDVWSFNLATRSWKKWNITPALGRSYHSLVGWEMTEGVEASDNDEVDESARETESINEKIEKEGRERGSIISYGGFRTHETVGGESIAFVFSDVIMSHPPKENRTIDNGYQTAPNFWYKAQMPPGWFEEASHRLEHTSVIDSTGILYIWGGRFKDVSDIHGLYSMNIFGPNSKVQFKIADTDGLDAYEAQLEKLHILVAIVLFMSVGFTALYGTLRRHGEDGRNGDGRGTAFLGRRRGVSAEIMETIPIKTFRSNSRKPRSENDNQTSFVCVPVSAGSAQISNDANRNEEAEVCPICLLDYEDGDEIRTMPCSHEFHKHCVDSWLQNNTSCPACRHSLCDHMQSGATTSNDQDQEQENRNPSSESDFELPRSYNFRRLISGRTRRFSNRMRLGAIRSGTSQETMANGIQYDSSLELQEENGEHESVPQQPRELNNVNNTLRTIGRRSGRVRGNRGMLMRSSSLNINASRVMAGNRRSLRRGERDATLNHPLTDSSPIV